MSDLCFDDIFKNYKEKGKCTGQIFLKCISKFVDRRQVYWTCRLLVDLLGNYPSSGFVYSKWHITYDALLPCLCLLWCSAVSLNSVSDSLLYTWNKCSVPELRLSLWRHSSLKGVPLIEVTFSPAHWLGLYCDRCCTFNCPQHHHGILAEGWRPSPALSYIHTPFSLWHAGAVVALLRIQ